MVVAFALQLFASQKAWLVTRGMNFFSAIDVPMPSFPTTAETKGLENTQKVRDVFEITFEGRRLVHAC